MDTKSVGIPNTSAMGARADALKARELQEAKKKEEIGSSLDVSKAKSDVNVKLSSEARQIAEAHKKAYDIARSTNPVRDDKVEEFKRLIASGQYQPDSGKIADGMLREAIKDDLSSRPVDIG